MTGVRVGVEVGVSVDVIVGVSVGVWALLIPFRLVEIRIRIKAQAMLLTNNLLIFMFLIPFYDFIHRKGVIRESNKFVCPWNKVNIVISHITPIPRRIE